MLMLYLPDFGPRPSPRFKALHLDFQSFCIIGAAIFLQNSRPRSILLNFHPYSLPTLQPSVLSHICLPTTSNFFIIRSSKCFAFVLLRGTPTPCRLAHDGD